jgi:hypothetical protein
MSFQTTKKTGTKNIATPMHARLGGAGDANHGIANSTSPQPGTNVMPKAHYHSHLVFSDSPKIISFTKKYWPLFAAEL